MEYENLTNELRELIGDNSHKHNIVFPSCFIYVEDRKIMPFDFDVDHDLSRIASFSKKYKIKICVLIEFDAMHEFAYLTRHSKYLVSFDRGKIKYGKEYEEIMKILDRRRKRK